MQKLKQYKYLWVLSINILAASHCLVGLSIAIEISATIALELCPHSILSLIFTIKE